MLGALLDRREDKAERRRAVATELRKRVAEADARLKRLYDAIESGIADLADESLKERIAEMRSLKAQAQSDAERASSALDGLGTAITPSKLLAFASAARRRLRGPAGGYRRDHLRALAQRVEIADREVRIMGSHSHLLRTLASAGEGQSAAAGVPTSVPKWRSGRLPYPAATRLF